jgi:hypothetical protein
MIVLAAAVLPLLVLPRLVCSLRNKNAVIAARELVCAVMHASHAVEDAVAVDAMEKTVAAVKVICASYQRRLTRTVLAAAVQPLLALLRLVCLPLNKNAAIAAKGLVCAVMHASHAAEGVVAVDVTGKTVAAARMERKQRKRSLF